MKTKDTDYRSDRNIELNQTRSKPDPVNCSVRTACTTVHHYNGTQYCSTETHSLTHCCA